MSAFIAYLFWRTRPGWLLFWALLLLAIGTGLYGSVSRWQQALIVIAVWMAVVIFARLWMARYRMGPLEWLWRSMTYGRAQSIS
jgi:uncharacterized protein